MKILYILIFLCLRNPTIAYPTGAGITNEIVIKAHSYHGIKASHEDEHGSYFMRNGKRCQLFTASFMKQYIKRERRK